MRDMTQMLFRCLCLAALLAAGSCTDSSDDANVKFDDPIANHPIAIEPSYQSLKLSWSMGGLNADEGARLTAFVADYREHGNGKIAISVPGGPSQQQSVTWMSDRINAMGISRDQILVASHDAADPRVEVNYISYQARSDACGDWSEDLAVTISNQTAANFGCASQHNLAAMVTDPRDLIGPRPFEDADGRRRQTVIGNYDDGKPTGATKSADQSGAVTDVGK